MAQQIANVKSLIIAQELILPAAFEMCEVMLGTQATNKLKAVPFSNDSMRTRTEELTGDIQSQLLDRLCSCEQFSVQLDTSTEIVSVVQLVVLFYCPWKGNILEDLLFSKDMPKRPTGEYNSS